MNKSQEQYLEKLEWDPLFIAGREALKMIREDFVKRDEANKELLALSKEIKAGIKKNLPSVERYKLNLINEAHVRISEGIFSMQDVENLQTYLGREDMTIFATPRELNAETEMAWGIISPLIDRLERWMKIEELRNAGVLREDEMEKIKALVVEGEQFGPSLDKSILFLDRMRYARHKGILDEKSYKKAIELIPLMKKELLGEVDSPVATMNSQEILEGMAAGDEAAFSEQITLAEDNDMNGLASESDPVDEWRKLIYILIDAWQTILKFDLNSEFSEVLQSRDLSFLQQIHTFLVHLNKEYIADGREEKDKNLDYHKKIVGYLGEFKKVRA